MYRIDKFLQFYNDLQAQMEIEPGVWVKARPLPFYYGILTKEYWAQRKQRKKDANAVLKGEAIAITWKSDIDNKNITL